MHRPIALTLLVVFCASMPSAYAIETSCDLITGASCLWKEGCDCDADGFVVDNNEKYCHYDECPLDADDNDPDVLGKSSENNEDGDAWTTKYDCNDKDICIDKNCDNICTLDQDADGYPANVDCNDENPFIYPLASERCCACDVILNIDKLAKYACGTPPCPYDDLNPAPDGYGSPPADAIYDEDTGISDGNASGPDGGKVEEDMASQYLPPSALNDVHFTGSGAGPERQASCSLSSTSKTSVPTIILGLSLLVLGARRRRHHRPPGAKATLISLMLVLFAITTLGACQTIRPWQREQLAKGPMTFDADPLENQLEQHFLQYRESASGGFGGSGGGCGCN